MFLVLASILGLCCCAAQYEGYATAAYAPTLNSGIVKSSTLTARARSSFGDPRPACRLRSLRRGRKIIKLEDCNSSCECRNAATRAVTNIRFRGNGLEINLS